SSAALAARVTAKVDALASRATALPETDADWKGLKPEVDRLLGMVRNEIAAGRVYAGLERLADANRYLGGTAYRITHPAMSKDLDGFMAGWSAAEAGMTAGEKAWRAASWSRIPAAVRGLAEIEFGQSRHLYQAARDYAAADAPSSGAHYVGEAEAALDYARFCQTLTLERSPGEFAARSVAPEIAELDGRVVASYQPPRSIDNHSDFIRINGTLKMAGELDAAGLYHGSLLTWLRALRLFSALEAGWSQAPARPVETLRAEAAAVTERLRAPSDGSVARLLQEQAESAIARATTPETAPLLMTAADVTLSQAVPAFAALRTRKAVKAVEAKDQVRVTLLRWPYT
ncbi:MAG TPA: hypothetical protein VJV75_04660, partial [Candidatus Polarisedimenticolia bacterium]|nr:hypothetical protein [Candidatus Polarisedimenticolia bacterium]